MDAAEQLKQDVRDGRIDIDRLIDVIGTLQRQLEAAKQPGQSHYFGKEKRSRDGTRGDLQQVLVIPASHFPLATYAYLGFILCQE